MKKTKANKQLPGQTSIFDSQKMEEIYRRAKAIGQEVSDELLALEETLSKMTLEEWSSAENKPRKDMKDCLLIAQMRLVDAILQLEKAASIEFQMRISKSLQ